MAEKGSDASKNAQKLADDYAASIEDPELRAKLLQQMTQPIVEKIQAVGKFKADRKNTPKKSQ